MAGLTSGRRRVRLAVLGAVVAAALLLAACSGSGSPAAGTGSTAFTSWPAYLAASRELGPLPGRTAVSVSLTARERDPAAASAQVAEMDDPSSPAYGTTMTPAQWEAAFGPSPATLAAAQREAAAVGARLSLPSTSTLGTLSGPASAISRLLRVAIDRWRGPDGGRFYSSLTTPVLPAALGAAFETPERVSNWAPPRHRDAIQETPAIPGSGLTPKELEDAYDIAPLLARGFDGSGETIVFYEVGDGYKPSDLATFDKRFGLPAPQITQIGPDQKEQGELIMDLETVHSLAPGARLVVYTSNPSTESGQDKLMQQMFRQHAGAIFSFSWGGCELANADPAFFVTGFQQAAAEGDTVIASSGDSGGYDCLMENATAPTKAGIGVSAPASSPYVLAVGGTRLSLNTKGGYYDETPWNYAISVQGTGGGVSRVYRDPQFQRQAQDGRWKTRTVPDVAAVGDPETGLLNYIDGSWNQGGGTSLATPIWAAITALMDQYLKKQGQKPLGFYDPALYALAEGSPSLPPFHDINTGGNLVYDAGPGYDLASGLGSPDVWNLAQDLDQYERNGGHV